MKTDVRMNINIDQYIDVDINIDDFISECSSDDIKYLIKVLSEEGYLNNHDIIRYEKQGDDIGDDILAEQLEVIYKSRMLLSFEETQFLSILSRKFGGPVLQY